MMEGPSPGRVWGRWDTWVPPCSPAFSQVPPATPPGPLKGSTSLITVLQKESSERPLIPPRYHRARPRHKPDGRSIISS